MAEKRRLDVLLVEKGLFSSREKAKTTIMAGLVKVDGKTVDKPGSEVPVDAGLEVKTPAIPYVSRGGLKLEKAIKEFGLDFSDKIVVDIGASTGGFTDCALKHGATKVYAIDVGYGQLDWKLRQDNRVINLERTNVRYLDRDLINDIPNLITIDVSFISLALVLPQVSELLSRGGDAVLLIKPQFEAGRHHVGKKGVVRDPAIHAEVIQKIIDTAGELGFTVKNLTFSPIKGPEGNIEYLLHLIKSSSDKESAQAKEAPISNPVNVKEVVDSAFHILK